MPTRPPKLCSTCRQAFREPRCPRCAPAWATSKRGGSTRAWRRLRLAVFDEQGFICAVDGCVELCTELDHINGWEQGDHRDNVQGLCVDHHREKTEQEARDAQALPPQRD